MDKSVSAMIVLANADDFAGMNAEYIKSFPWNTESAAIWTRAR